MAERIDIKDFYRKCGQTSTPIKNSQRQSRSRDCDRTNQRVKSTRKDHLSHLLSGRELWPVTFKTACQDHLNELQLELNREFLLTPVGKEKRRRLSPLVTARSRSRARDRSMSPSGAKNMKETKWESKAEVAILLIDEMLRRTEDWPATLLLHSQSDCEAKRLLNAVSKAVKSEQKKAISREGDVTVLGQALRVVLAKIGVILPAMISEQLGLLPSIIVRTNGHLVRSRRQTEAVQTLFLNIPTTSRTLLQKLIAFFKVLSDSRVVSATELHLAAILHPNLFEDQKGPSQIALCRDLIVLADKVFDAPDNLVDRLRDALNTRPDTRLFEGILKSPKRPAPSARNLLPSYFLHTKSTVTPKPDSVVLTAVNKIQSPDQLGKAAPSHSAASKANSFTDFKKKIFMKSSLPFRKSREYVISDFSAHKQLPLAN